MNCEKSDFQVLGKKINFFQKKLDRVKKLLTFALPNTIVKSSTEGLKIQNNKFFDKIDKDKQASEYPAIYFRV